LSNARQLLGKLFHTLQDFYSHSNWIEMGKTDINTHIGKDELIGNVAASNQATCRSESCTKIEKNCVRKSNFYSLFFLIYSFSVCLATINIANMFSYIL